MKSLFSTCLLQDKLFHVAIESNFTFTIKKVNEIPLSLLNDYLQSDRNLTSVTDMQTPDLAYSILEILLRQSPSSRFSSFGNGGGKFFTDQNSQKITSGLAVHHGWSQSIRPSDGKFAKLSPASEFYRQLLLNIDVAATTFYQTGPLADICVEFFGRRSIGDLKQVLGRDGDRKRLDRFLRGVSIDITYQNTLGRTRYKVFYFNLGFWFDK